MNEQEFQLEMERFKQKESWENKTFYLFLGLLISVILFYVQENRIGENSFLYWLGGLALFLIICESLVNCYLDKEKQKIKEKIGAKK